MLSFTFQYASLWRRIVAGAIDFVASAAIGAILLLCVFSVLGLRLAHEPLQHAPASVLIVRTYGVWLAFSLGAAWLYFAFMESSRGQATIGKRIMGLMVFTKDEGRLTFREASLRFWAKLLAALPAF